MDNISPLHSGINLQSSVPNEAVIAAMRNLLDMAEDGRLRSFIGTGFVNDGNRVAIWCDFHDNVYEMLGAINWLEHEFVDRRTSGE